MKDIDVFLRKIWLDCYGHMSGFSHKRAKVSMLHAVENVFAPKVKYNTIMITEPQLLYF